MATRTGEIEITECSGCFDPDCPVCEPHTSQGGWRSAPSTIHGTRTAARNQPSEKQMDYLRSLLRHMPDGERKTQMLDAIEHGINKQTCSAFIDEAKNNATVPPSDKQRSYLDSLLDQRAHSFGPELINQARTDRRVCSATIDQLRGFGYKTKGSTASTAELEDGIYRTPDGDIFKVYVTVHGAKQKVAKRLVKDDEAKSGWTFQYEGKRPLRDLTSEMRMTLEQAKKFGAVYGVCCVCCATLTNETSIEAGIGPVCAGRL